jgi:hypothetical protein
VIRGQFLAGAHIVVDAIAEPAVGAAWDEPSVLAGQTVGGLAGHLARGAVWVVGDYLDQPPPAAAVFESADHYFATLATLANDAANKAIRDRGAAVGAAGQTAVVADATARLAVLEARLPAEPDDRITVVAGGSMRLDDYLITRMVEQVVHLDDLARSIGVEPWVIPDQNVRLVLVAGVGTGLRRSGPAAMLRALYRDDASALPVL